MLVCHRQQSLPASVRPPLPPPVRSQSPYFVGNISVLFVGSRRVAFLIYTQILLAASVHVVRLEFGIFKWISATDRIISISGLVLGRVIRIHHNWLHLMNLSNYSVQDFASIRLVVLESGLGLESGLKSVFAGLGLGL